MAQKLLIIMREDLWDMNPGKGMAQAAHAQADFSEWCNTLMDRQIDNRDMLEQIKLWKEGRSFGVTITLAAPLATMYSIQQLCSNNAVPNGMTIDPTYPYRNYYGKVFTANEVTCMWVFVGDAVSAEVQDEIKKSTALHG